MAAEDLPSPLELEPAEVMFIGVGVWNIIAAPVNAKDSPLPTWTWSMDWCGDYQRFVGTCGVPVSMLVAAMVTIPAMVYLYDYRGEG